MDKRVQKLREAQETDRNDAKQWSTTWDRLTNSRLEAARRGETSPWLGLKQWLVEIPMDANLRGYNPEAEQVIKRREQQFQDAMQGLKSNPKQPVPSIWSGVR